MDRTQAIGVVILIIAIVAIGGYLYVSSNTTNTKIEFESNQTLKSGDTINFTVKDEFKNPIPEAAIDLKVLDESGNSEKATIITDSEGRGSYTLPVLENGNYTVHCTFNSTLYHKEARNQMALTIDDGYSESSY